MGIRVGGFEDVRLFSGEAQGFLRSRPVLHNLMLTIVESRLTQPQPGRYWVAWRGDELVGAALQSPLVYPATVVPMETEVVGALVQAIVQEGVALPGVNGEAATAASFAGQWTECCKSAAVPVQGLRLYELIRLEEMRTVEGELRSAVAGDRDQAVGWLERFYVETHMPPVDAGRYIDTALAGGRLWLWEDGGVVSMAVSSAPMEGVVRISGVYTPMEKRGRGYAGACVHGVSRRLTGEGLRCALYTDLGNPTSNSIYRRIGYRAVAEAIHYRFDAV